MRVAFLLPSLSPSGGTRVVCAHAGALRREQDIEAVIVLTGPAGRHPVDGALDVPVIALGEAREQGWDVAVATWWTTSLVMHELPAGRHLVFAQGEDERSYGTDEPFDRLGAAAALALADGVLAVSEHLAEAVTARLPDVWCRVVPVGIDKRPYSGLRRSARPGGAPFRVLVEGQPTLRNKRVQEAVAAVRAAAAPVHVTLAALDLGSAEGLAVDELTSPRDARAMAELYARSDVLVKLSRTEGLGLPPLEAAHVGTPSILTPYGGHRAWLRHGRNGILVGFDDEQAVSDWVTRLAADPELLDELGDQALRTSARWPDVSAAAASWARALDESVTALPGRRSPATGAAAVLSAHVALGRTEHVALRGMNEWQASAIRSYETQLEQRRADVAERDATIARLNALVSELFEDRDAVSRRLEEIEASRAYRTATTARRAYRRVVGPGRGTEP